ncbi:MAG: LysM peptidoglycan-binding domain-containing protein [Bacillota bacterium]
MEAKLHLIKVKRANERRRKQEKIIKFVVGIVLIFSLIFVTVVVAQAVTKKYQTVIVKKGDTVWNIANRVGEGKNVRVLVNEISIANGIDEDMVVSGQRILVPVG